MTEPFEYERVAENLDKLKQKAQENLVTSSELDREDLEYKYGIDMRYKNQVNELEVSIDDENLTPETVSQLSNRFEQVYEQRYGEASTYAPSPVEIVTYRVYADLPTSNPEVRQFEDSRDSSDAYWKQRDVYWPSKNEYVTTDIYDGTELSAGLELAGPSIIQMPETTITVRPHQTAMVDKYKNVTIEKR
jgi:N-methylhydantoinase A